MKGYVQLSRLLQPVNIAPKNAEVKYAGVSKSQKLLVDSGYIRSCGTGLIQLMPLGVRVIEKLCGIVATSMEEIGAQRVSFPAISDSTLWKKSGRWDPKNAEQFTLKDRHGKDYLLCPTQEEMAAEVLGLFRDSGLIYQMGPKYRDEPRPKGGLLRAREFIMKDMYSGDLDQSSAKATYSKVRKQYGVIMKELNLPVFWAKGDVGEMGGIESHELHLACDAGEDNIRICTSCQHGVNSSLMVDTCPQCSSPLGDSIKAIEVGHTFLLGTRYSEPLNVTVLKDGKKQFIFMGSYGIGITRLAAAAVEVLSTSETIRWPLAIAPFSVVVIPPKVGSKEESMNQNSVMEMCLRLESTPWLSGDLLIDDRPLTIGRRLIDANKTGIPVAVVIGGRNATAEVHSVYDGHEDYASNVDEAIAAIRRIIIGETDSVDCDDRNLGDEARM